MIPRFILAADHRDAFDEFVKGRSAAAERVGAFKALVVKAMMRARDKAPRAAEHGALLLDAQYASAAIVAARRAGIPCGEPLDLVNGALEALVARAPDFAKVLVRVSGKDDDQQLEEASRSIAAALQVLARAKIPLVVELLFDGSENDALGRSISWIERWKAAPKPTHWKLVGDPNPDKLKKLVELAPEGATFSMLGGGESAQTLERWFAAAQALPSFIGFVVGRTIFWKPFEQWWTGAMTDEAVIEDICERYLGILSRWPDRAPSSRA